MTLIELLEALNTVLPYKKIEDTPTRVQYGIAFKDTLFVVVFDVIAPKHAIVSFYEQNETNQPEFGMTNKIGYAGGLFATIVHIIQESFTQYDLMAYTASGTSRKSLYGQLAKKYSHQAYVYIIPTPTVEVTIISKRQLQQDEKQAIATTAQEKLA